MPRARTTDAAAVLADRGIVVIDQFLSGALCRQIVLESRKGIWLPSTVAEGDVKARSRRTSGNGRNSSTLCDHHPSERMRRCTSGVEGALESILDINPDYLEPWQVTIYVAGQGFDFHLDCGGWRNHVSGERRRSILLYLQTPEGGGQTFFRALNIRVRPIAGRLAVWNNLLPNGNCNHAMVHAGLPVTRGCKMILSTWERERPFVRASEEKNSYGNQEL